MINATRTLYLYVESSLHAGVGSGLSSIDLPIQRERTTQYPMIQGSGVKGKLRAVAEETLPEDIVTILFGPKDTGADHAGALIAGDARLLLFPVRSLNGVFAYTTSRDVLERFRRAYLRERPGSEISWDVSKLPKEKEEEQQPPVALVTQTKNSQVSASNTLVLEEFSFQAQPNEEVDRIATWLAKHALPDTHAYWQEKLQQSLVILPDDDFRDFALYATEIITRIRINREKKTVDKGALWTEEHLPSDTLLYVPIYATDSRKANTDITAAQILSYATALEEHRGGYIQLGGDETVGRGLVRMHWEAE